MPLVSMKSLMNDAQDNNYAIGYFEAWNLEAILSVINAAERVSSPIIIGFSGMFLGNDARKVPENIYHYGALGKAIAENAKVPCALLLNEADKIGMLIQGLKAGFNAVMFQDTKLPFEETVKITKYLSKTAHFVGADVEAEVGELPDSDVSTGSISQGENTDPEKAIWFAKECEIDALAIACGNVHLLEGGTKATLDFDLIKNLKEKMNIPLVLHGGTGISDESLKHAIELGISKVNVGTVMKRVYLNYIKDYIKAHNTDKIDPHDIIGRGGDMDMLVGAREAVTEEVIRFLKVFGSINKAK